MKEPEYSGENGASLNRKINQTHASTTQKKKKKRRRKRRKVAVNPIFDEFQVNTAAKETQNDPTMRINEKVIEQIENVPIITETQEATVKQEQTPVIESLAQRFVPSSTRVESSEEPQSTKALFKQLEQDRLRQMDPQTEKEKLQYFKRVFSQFYGVAQDEQQNEKATLHANDDEPSSDDDEAMYDTSDEEENAIKKPTGPRLNKKQKRRKHRYALSELKAWAPAPEVVKEWDTASHDPHLLVYLKSYRNSVPVMDHWSRPGNYLQHKRLKEHITYELPAYIRKTGIQKAREAAQKRMNAMSAKQKARARARAKLQSISVDYAALYDAFFKYQKKPTVLSRFGEIYYQGREYEWKIRDFQPGRLSEEARKALGMPPQAPPPWLINMQTHGPPPSYPLLRIPGLNAPIPEGTSWGFHPGGWGSAPIDEHGQPLYGGDLFGHAGASAKNAIEEERRLRDAPLWGIIADYQESDDDDDDDEDDSLMVDDVIPPPPPSTITTTTEPSSSSPPPPPPSNVPQVEMVSSSSSPTSSFEQKSLYTVLPQIDNSNVDDPSRLGSSTHTYSIPSSALQARHAHSNEGQLTESAVVPVSADRERRLALEASRQRARASYAADASTIASTIASQEASKKASSKSSNLRKKYKL